MHVEQVTKYDDKVVFQNTGKIFTLRGDVLKMITDYIFITADSPDAKLIIDIIDEMHFDIRSRGKTLRDRNLIINHINKKTFIASGFTTIFLSKSLIKSCDKLELLFQEKRAGNISDITIEKIVPIIGKLLECKCSTPTQHQKII